MYLQVKSMSALSGVAQQLMKYKLVLCVSSQRAQALSCDGEENRPDHSALVSPTSQRGRLQVDRERTLSEGAQQHRKDRHALTEETSRLAQKSLQLEGAEIFPKPLRFSLADNQESPPARG